MSKPLVHSWPVNVPKWRKFLKDQEKQRLDVLEERISRKQTTLDELVTERHRLMRRCITRARRDRNGQ